MSTNNFTTRGSSEVRRSPRIPARGPDRITRTGALLIVISFLLLVLILHGAIAPEYRSYPPNTITVTTGTGTGTVDDLYSVDAVIYSVLEEDVGTSSTHTATEEWIVRGALVSGTFPDDTETQDGTGAAYQEVDDDNGALTGDSYLLTPTADGTYIRWGSPLTHFDDVDDDPPHDGDVTYVHTVTNAWLTDTYVMEDLPALPAGTKEAGTVTVFSWAKEVNFDGETNNTVYTYGTLYDEGSNALTAAYLNNTWVLAANPNTGNQWTLAEIAAMEVGISGKNDNWGIGGNDWVTSVGAVVPTQDLNYVLDVRHNVTSVPAGREFYVLTMRALTTQGEDITVSVYDHVAPGWDTAFVIANNTYDTRTFALVEADHVNAGEVWLRYTDAGGDNVIPDSFDIDLLQVRAYNVEHVLEVSFSWVGLEGQRGPRLSVVGYKSDAETFTLQVLRTGVWVALSADILQNGVMASWSFTLSPADVEGNALQVRFIDNDDTDNAASTIYLDLLTVQIEVWDDDPAAPIDVYVDVSYDLWRNEIILRVSWTQTGGPEPAIGSGKWVTVWVDGVELGTYTVGNGTRRVGAPWSFFDGKDHNVTAIGAVNVVWPTWDAWQTYFSDPELERVSNFPRFAVLMFGLFCLLAVVAIVAVRAIQKRRGDDEKGP